MNDKQHLLRGKGNRRAAVRRRWRTVLVPVVVLLGVLTPPAMAAPSAADSELTYSVARSEGANPSPPEILKADPNQPVDPDASPAVAPSGAKPVSVMEYPQGTETSAVELAAGCTPSTNSDLPHKSSNGLDVSAHAWWYKGTCSNNRATVTACLYEYYSDNTWRQKACNKDYSQPPGKSYKLNVRKRCGGNAFTAWAVWVDVDVNWEVDTGEISWKWQNVYCRVT